MTREQTRELGVEFERRLIEVSEEFQINRKLDTDTIYSMLSEFQSEYIKSMYVLAQKAELDSREYKRIQDIVKTLIRQKTLSQIDVANNNKQYNYITFNIPDNYYMYIRSSSIVDKTYKSNSEIEPALMTNETIKQDLVNNIIESVSNKGGILRHPVVVLESTDRNSPYIKIIHDRYTNVISLDLTYYCSPYNFNVLNYDDNDMSSYAVHSYCELPYSCFNDLVSGALDLYLSKYKFRLQSSRDNKQQQKEQSE